MFNKKIFFVCCSFLFVVLFSCKEDTERLYIDDLDKDVTTNYTQAQALVFDLLKVAEDVMSQNNKFKRTAVAGKNTLCIDVDTTYNAGKTILELTFGENCTSYDGHIRKGTVLVILNGDVFNKIGNTYDIETSNYTLDGLIINAKVKVSCIASNTYQVQAMNLDNTTYMNFKNTSGDMMYANFNFVKVVETGAVDATIFNDIYRIEKVTEETPIATVKSYKGIEFDVNLAEFMYMNMECPSTGFLRIPTQGKVYFNYKNITRPDRGIYYGEGNCDNSVQIQYNLEINDISI